MSPPVEEWPATELSARVYAQANGRRRKLPAGESEIDLSKCPLYEIVQYACEPEERPDSEGKKLIRCQPLVRSFRKYVVFELAIFTCEQFMAEVTALEGKHRR